VAARYWRPDAKRDAIVLRPSDTDPPDARLKPAYRTGTDEQERAGEKRQGFPRAMRLLKRAEYEAVYGAGQRRSSPQFSVFFRAQLAHPKETTGRELSREESPAVARAARNTSRFGISVKKALGGAVVRNRIKRRIREILRRNRMEIPTGWDIVIHPKAIVARAAFAPLETELLRLLRGIQNTVRSTAPKA